ncbi:hypothetical protein [Marinicella sp. W31]|uniref:hypothetical protein n=1 Tax=Marinicella sp. W31 TaxID=3023713 RepID=UPI0037574D9F
MKFSNCIVLFLLIGVFSVQADGIFKCVQDDGTIKYTEKQADCDNAEDLTNRKKANDKTSVNYRFPLRSYAHKKGGIWDIYVEESMVLGDPKLYNDALNKLNKTLEALYVVLPDQAKSKLKQLNVFLLWGEAAPKGGRKNGMSFIRVGEPDNYHYLDPKWENAIVIYSAENLMYLNELWSKKALFHELSHAWHILNWPEKHPPIYEPWEQSKHAQRYTHVKDIKGTVIKSAYARKNQLEYFAELSAMYFVGGNYYPYDKAGLKKYDPEGYAMVESLWN